MRVSREILRRAAFHTACLGVIVCALLSIQVVSAAAIPHEPADRPVVLDSPTYLVEKHDCWTGVDSREPGHVVVTTKGGRTVYGARHLDAAIAQQFFGEDHGLTIHGFCE